MPGNNLMTYLFMAKIPQSALACIVLLFFAFSGCEEDKEIVTYSNLDVSHIKDFQYIPKDSVICRLISQHQDFHKTQIENFESHYDVIGFDKEGNELTGYADIEKGEQYGKGVIEDETGREIEIDVEWMSDGKLKAKDEQGNTWELTIEE